jgi:hypothetical protein
MTIGAATPTMMVIIEIVDLFSSREIGYSGRKGGRGYRAGRGKCEEDLDEAWI